MSCSATTGPADPAAAAAVAPRAGPLREGAAGPRTRHRHQPRDQHHPRGAGHPADIDAIPPRPGDQRAADTRGHRGTARRHPPAGGCRSSAGRLSASPAGRAQPGPGTGVAMISQLLAYGTGPLQHQACTEDLGDIIENVRRALTRQPPLHRAEMLSGPAKPMAPQSKRVRSHLLENGHSQKWSPPSRHPAPPVRSPAPRATRHTGPGDWMPPRPPTVRAFTPSGLDVATHRSG